jgi:hypothetical protein
VQLEPSLRIWGTRGTVRLTPAALALFPELQAAGGRQTPGNEAKVTIPLTFTEGSGQTVSRAIVCALVRGEQAALERVSSTDVSAALVSQLAPGFDRFPRRMERVVERLTADGGWRLTLSNDARQALPLLRRMLDEAD